MNSRNSSLLCVALALLALSSAVKAFDITKMLAQYPDLSSFNQHLTETKLADQINSRQTITVLAVDNSGISALSGKPPATIKAILSTHVVLDYYDEMKLMSSVENQQTQLTTLYQTTGPTNSQMGFIKVGLIGEGEIAFGSAVSGAPLDVELVKTVVSQPYNISILQVTRPIIAPGIDGQSSKSASSPASSSAPKAEAPSSAPKEKAPSASSPSPSSETPAAKAPAASRKQISPSSETSPSSEASPAPEISPSPEEAGAPLSDEEAPSDAPVPASGSSPRIQTGLVWAGLMGFVALLVAM
ncbi:fasciclin-like arabinogalactan protein 3 [Neltuma alba]|uniref:fasciclin-like arabinogalactan protein 3 n=1 Tax=Neltuma alba TaxID=207710 RepID=UPI0010A45710|nr:fasciclin-like arabinogalactan protein 3 [Prosopis alba]XP_028798365.1 fasciclin-like arabinogalactan protein 3 [Prosopis alba]